MSNSIRMMSLRRSCDELVNGPRAIRVVEDRSVSRRCISVHFFVTHGEPSVIDVSSDCQGVKDRVEISDLVFRCAFALDSRDWALLATCFTSGSVRNESPQTKRSSRKPK